VDGIRGGNTVREVVVELAVSLAVHHTVGHVAARNGADLAVTRVVHQETITTAVVAAATRENELASGRFVFLFFFYEICTQLNIAVVGFHVRH
jgi:hypothetical protein